MKKEILQESCNTYDFLNQIRDVVIVEIDNY
jgi:hypothetical protein